MQVKTLVVVMVASVAPFDSMVFVNQILDREQDKLNSQVLFTLRAIPDYSLVSVTDPPIDQLVFPVNCEKVKSLVAGPKPLDICRRSLHPT
jgi:hypothetical protein